MSVPRPVRGHCGCPNRLLPARGRHRGGTLDGGGPLDDPRGQLRRLSVLIAASGVDMIGFAMILPLLPFYALELKASPVVIGLILSSFSVAQLISAPLWGRVSDRYGRRPALLIGLFASAAAYTVFGLATRVWLLFASRIIQGAGGRAPGGVGRGGAAGRARGGPRGWHKRMWPTPCGRRTGRGRWAGSRPR